MLMSFFPLHTGGSASEGWLHSDWQFDPSVLVVSLAMLVGYFWLVGPFARKRSKPATADGKKIAFLAAVFSLVVALGQPLDGWASDYLVSAHMFQHLILMMLTAPLLLKGIPAWFFEPLGQHRYLDAFGRFLTRAVPSLVVGSALTVIWHLPALYDRALNVEPVHVTQHAAFLVAAVLMWWPIVRPNPAWPEMQPLVQMLYLFATTLPGGFVGAFITFAEPGIYRHYLTVPRLWDISLASDQEAAGLMMWVGVPAVYLLIITVIFFRWASSEERKEREAQVVGFVGEGTGGVT